VDLNGFHGGTIARGDVAKFVIDQLANNAFWGSDH